jgi:CheY-like chemotaxis protein
MQKRIVVVDDDIDLVADVSRYSRDHALGIEVIGPPNLLLDIRDISEKSADAVAIILDLKMGGSGSYGRSILKNLRRELKRPDIPVLVWSKYLTDTVLFDRGRVLLLDNTNYVAPPKEIDAAQLATLTDWATIRDMRHIYAGVCAFVTKAIHDPVALIFQVSRYVGLLGADGQLGDGQVSS